MPMRIVSLLPSATEILFALGLGDELVGVTDGCDFPPEARDVPVVLRAGVLDGDALESLEPDLILAPDAVRASRGGGAGRPRRPPAVEPGASRGLDAVLVEAVDRLDAEVTVLRLGPTSIEGILNSIQTVGAMTETEDAAMFVVQGLRERLQAIEEIVVGRRDHGFRSPRVAALGGADPPLTMGLWVPEQVRLAGGWELLGIEGGASTVTSWDAIREVEPEILVLMPPALDLAATIADWERAQRPHGWEELRAVVDRRVFAVDGAAYFARPGPRVIDGIEVLTELIDPVAFDGMSPPDSWERVA
jgi:iron complex transport system substrate-binding protein